MGILDEYYGKKSAQSATSEESTTAFDPERYSHIKPLSDFAAPVREEPKPRTNTPGLMSDIKRASGQFISGAGSALRDVGAEQLGGSIEQYGTGIVQRNPSEITSFSDVLSRPFTTAREAVGEVAPQVGLAVGGQVAGRVVGGALGIPFGPAGIAVGQQVGGFVGGLLPAAVQTYGGIRSEQREKGIEEKGRALAVTIPAALLERFGGAERVALRVAGEGTEFLARELGTNAYKAAAKQFARGGVEELLTEIPQTALERYGVTGEAADLTSPEAMDQYGVAGAKAFLGGGTVRAGLSVAAGTRKDPMVTIQPDGTITSDQPLPGADGEVDLTNPNNVVTTAADAAKKLSEFDPYAVIAERAAAGRPMSAEEATKFLSSSLAAQKAGQQYIDLMQSKEDTLGRIGQVGEQYQRMVGRRGDQLLGIQETGDLARPIVSRLQDETQQQEAPYIAAAQAGAGAQQLPGMQQGAGTQADFSRIMNPDVMEPVEPQGYEPLARTDLLPAQPAPFSNMRLDRPGPQESLTGPTSQLSDRPVPPEPAPASPLVAQATTLPPAPAAGGVSSTPATTTQDGAQTTQAKQTKAKKQKAPITAGSVVKVNDTEVTLDEAQAVAWNKAQEAYEGKARRARELTNYQERESGLRAAGMQLSAERRKITGALTTKEQEAAKRVAARQTAEQKAQDEMGLTAALQTANRTKVTNNPLQAGVEGADKKPVPGKTSLTVNSLRNIRDALLNPSATVEGISDQEQQIADAVRAFAKSYYKFSNAGGNMLRGVPTETPILDDKGRVIKEDGETVYKSTKLAGQTPAQQRGQIKAKTGIRVGTTLDQLGQTRQALAGLGRAVNGNAKDVEAIVKLVKDMVQQKLHTEVGDDSMNEDFGQKATERKDGRDPTDVAYEKMDTMLSQGWRAAKDNMFRGESDAAFVRQTPIRNSAEATAAGVEQTPLEEAAQGQTTFGSGKPATGILGVLRYIRNSGTPFERTIAKGVYESLYDSDTAPNLVFITEGKPYYDPKTNTVYIQRDASAAVTLHEALHSALQWYVYQNPDAPEVRALKAALKRVVNFKGDLSPDAKRVQDVLKTLMKDKKELDAVLELVSYGNTLNDFRRALEAMDSTEAPKSFYDAAKNVWQAILTTVQKLVGVRPSVAADVIGNTFKLLEAAGASRKDANVGNKLESKISTLTDAFKNWFKDSKVVDNDGNPLVVYHGTVGDFDTFSKELLGSSTMTESAKRGFFFGGNADTANTFARIANRYMDSSLTPEVAEANFKSFVESAKAAVTEAEASKDATKIANAKDSLSRAESAFASFLGMRQNIMPVYLSMQNPLVVDQKGKSYRNEPYANTIARATAGGYDGVIIKNTYDGSDGPSVFDRVVAKLRGKNIPSDTIYIVFEPNQIKSAIGNRGTYDPNSNNILEAAVESTGTAQPKVTPLDLRIYNKKVAPAALSTKFVFDLVGWQRGAAKVGELSAKLATTIRKDFPTAERYITYLNSTFGANAPTIDAMRNYKVDKNTGYQRMEQLANFVESRSAEEANALFDYLDGNKKALDKFADADKMKEIADSVEKSMALYISQLPEKDKAYFENTKFSESLLFAGNTNQVASHTFGARKLSEIIGLQHRFEETIDGFQHWMGKDANGDVDITGPFYQVFGPNIKDPAGPQVPQGYMSIKEFNAKGNPVGFTVDPSRQWRISGKKGEGYKFTSNMTAQQAILEKKVTSLANAMRNTMAALANNYASRNFSKAASEIGYENGKPTALSVAFDNVADIKEVRGSAPDESQILNISKDEAKTPQIADLYRNSNTWVRIPNVPAYGALAGKLMPGPVWSAMTDMSDRKPLVSFRAYNGLMRWFKKSKTVYNPGTHVTNIASNVTLAMMHDIPVSTMASAAKLFAKYELNPKSLTKTELAIMSQFMNSGAMLGDYSSAEVKEAIYKAWSENLSQPTDTSLLQRLKMFTGYEKSKAQMGVALAAKAGNKIDNVASELYAAEDNIFRLAAFMKKVGELQEKNGETTPSAETYKSSGDFAREAFLDYDIDSKAVRIARQSVLPFVSWLYAITPVMGRIAMHQPWKIANVMMVYYLIDVAMASAAGDDDEEKRKQGPEYARERMFGIGPYTHIRIPFMGDDKNPVYYRLGDYVPMASAAKGLPNGFMGQSWWPGSLTPSGPMVSAIIGFVGGVDPYTAKPLNQPTDSDWEKLGNMGKFAYDIVTPPAVSSRQVKAALDIMNDKTGPTGAAVSDLAIARSFGLKLYEFNVDESAYYKSVEIRKLQRDYRAAMTKAARDEYRKGKPDPAALEKEIGDLRERLMEAIDKARGEE